MDSVRIHAGSVEFTSEVREDPDMKKAARKIVYVKAAIMIAVSLAGLFIVMVCKLRGLPAILIAAPSLLVLAAGARILFRRKHLAEKFHGRLMEKMQEDNDPKFSTFATSILLNQKRTDAIRIPGSAVFPYTNMRSDSDERAALFVIDDRAIIEIDFDDKEEFMAFEEARREGRDILLTADTYR